jgi:hypothetical protein
MLELGGEHSLAQRLPGRRGDALDVGAVTGPDAGPDHLRENDMLLESKTAIVYGASGARVMRSFP